MKKLSRWGKRNPRKAQLIITIAHIIIWNGAIALGAYTYIFDIVVSQLVTIILTTIILISFLLYPVKGQKKGIFRYSYIRRKFFDFLLITAHALLITSTYNQIFTTTEPIKNENAQLITYDVNSNPKMEEGTSIWKTFKAKRKKLRQKIKAKLNKRKEYTSADLIFEIIGIIILMLIAGYFLVELACRIRCSGYTALAFIVLFVGGFGILTGSFIWIRSRIIKRKKVAESTKNKKD